VPDAVQELLATEVALDKLGARGISTAEAEQIPRNRHRGDQAMSKNPWTAPNPQPGDFDAELGMIDPGRVDAHEGNPQAKLRILVSVEGEDAKRLERIAEARGKKPGDVVAELLRDADRPAA